MTHALIHADLLAHLRGNQWLVQNGYIPKAHAVLCDPPYGLEFMGKEWDKPKPSGAYIRDPNGGRGGGSWGTFKMSRPDAYVAGVDFQSWVTEWAALLLDYVYPGGLLMAFGGTRTYHRLTAGLEDAGWEISDGMVWTYGSGFPKSLDISKALDKEAGAAREVVGESQNGYSSVSGKMQIESGYRPRDYYTDADGTFDVTAPATPLAARWQGWGTALKPSYESVVIARAPRGKRTYAALAREFGTGALAIDAARIGTNGESISIGFADSKRDGVNGGHEGWLRPWMQDGEYHAEKIESAMEKLNTMGRWPANFGLVCACESDGHAADCPVRVLGEQSGETRAGKVSGTGKTPGVGPNSWFTNGEAHRSRYDDEPVNGAARFFYQAKAAAWEREAGLHDRARRNVNDGRSTPIDNPFQRGDTQRLNTHPTLKPIRLAEYLATLLLPPELDEPRRLLVPFAGSGSEMIGALLAGWDVVTGIEREAEYVELARARVGWWAQFSTYDEARAAYEQGRKERPAPVVADDAPVQMDLFETEAKHA